MDQVSLQLECWNLVVDGFCCCRGSLFDRIAELFQDLLDVVGKRGNVLVNVVDFVHLAFAIIEVCYLSAGLIGFPLVVRIWK